MTSPAASRAAGGIPWLVVAGVLVAALSFRGPIVAPTPVMHEIEADFGVGEAVAGLLTTVPVLMFAAFTPVAAFAIRRAGAEVALLASLSGVLAGTFIRALPGFGWMLVGMLVIGASITIGNVVVPVIIRRDVPPRRVALVTAAYVALLNAGSLLTALLTVPLADLIGWTWALVTWSGVTLAGVVLWGVHLRASRGDEAHDRPGGGAEPSPSSTRDRSGAVITGPVPVAGTGSGPLLRRPVAWLLMGAFGGQTLAYYALTTWLPTFAADELGQGASASGALASLYQGVAIIGALLIPLLIRFTPRVVPALVICASWLVLMVGLLVAPELLAVWLSIGAIGHAGGFVVIFSALVAVTRSDAEAAGMSAFVQGCGYILGALGGPLAGALHEATGGWDAVLVVLLVIAVAYSALLLVALAVAARSRP